METYIAEKLKNTLEICLRGIAQLLNKWLLHIALVSLGCCNKHKRLDSLNNRICFSHFWRMEVWDQVPTWFIWWEHTSWLACGLFLAASSNGLFMSIETHTHRGRERERESSFSSYKAANLIKLLTPWLLCWSFYICFRFKWFVNKRNHSLHTNEQFQF